MANYNFKKDFARSNLHEFHIKKILDKKHKKTFFIPKEYQKQFGDIIAVDGKNSILYECKEDLMCARTGNIAIEAESRNKLSGISISQAHIWIISAHRQSEIKHCFIESKKLKELVDDKQYKFLHTGGGDKYSNTKNFIFELKKIEEHSNLVISDKRPLYEKSLKQSNVDLYQEHKISSEEFEKLNK